MLSAYQFLQENWKTLFGGAGAAVLAAIAGAWAKNQFEKRPKATQEIKSGANSVNIQGGGDVIATKPPPKSTGKQF
jgi:hypothetical protein